MLFQRGVNDPPTADNSFVFPLTGFTALKRMIVSRQESDGKVSQVADATVLYANDLIVTIRQRGFRFSELIEFIMKYNDKRMPENLHGLYDLLPVTHFGMFAGDLSNGKKIECFSEHTEHYSDDVVNLPEIGWYLREITISMPSILTESDANSLVMSLTASAPVADRISGQYAGSVAASVSALMNMGAQAVPIQKLAPTVQKKLKPALVIKRGPNPGQVHYLDKSPVRIGRDEVNDISLMTNGISRRHALITVEGDKVILTDLGSTNGTYVNTKRIQQIILKPGDEIFMGTAIFTYEMRD